MNRFVLSIGCSMLLLICPAFSSAAELSGLSACAFGQKLRLALGLGPDELAAMGVNGAGFNTIAAACGQFGTNNRQTLEPLLEAVVGAQDAALAAYECNAVDIAQKDEACRGALDDLEAQCGNLIATIYATLDSTQETRHARRLGNPLLDVNVAMLDLTAQQVSDIRAAQQARDEVLKHHKSRKNLNAVKQAWDAFEAELGAILTQAQQADRNQLLQASETNNSGALQNEETLCGD